MIPLPFRRPRRVTECHAYPGTEHAVAILTEPVTGHHVKLLSSEIPGIQTAINLALQWGRLNNSTITFI